jgi:PBP1b-binding outer membrane lipoprotein LpoB
MKKIISVIIAASLLSGCVSQQTSEPKKETQPTKHVKTEEEIKKERIQKMKADTTKAIGDYSAQTNPIIGDLTDSYNKISEINERILKDYMYLGTPQYQQDVDAISTELNSLAERIRAVNTGSNLGIQHAHEYMLEVAKDLHKLADDFKYYMTGGFKHSDLETMQADLENVKYHMKQSQDIVLELASSAL